MIRIINVCLEQQKKQILKNISCEIPLGRISCLIGSSGAGKTSLLKCIATLQRDYTGSILVEETEIKLLPDKQRAKLIGFVSQHFNLFPHMTVLDNCVHPLKKIFGLSEKEAEIKACEHLTKLGLQDKFVSYPSHLSGGQQQRVAIARALCLEPKILLFDEPTSALDPKNTQVFQKIITMLNQQGISILISSHDMAFVNSLLDCVYFLENGELIESYDVKKSDHILGVNSKIQNFLAMEQK